MIGGTADRKLEQQSGRTEETRCVVDRRGRGRGGERERVRGTKQWRVGAARAQRGKRRERGTEELEKRIESYLVKQTD